MDPQLPYGYPIPCTGNGIWLFAVGRRNLTVGAASSRNRLTSGSRSNPQNLCDTVFHVLRREVVHACDVHRRGSDGVVGGTKELSRRDFAERLGDGEHGRKSCVRFACLDGA